MWQICHHIGHRPGQTRDLAQLASGSYLGREATPSSGAENCDGLSLLAGTALCRLNAFWFDFFPQLPLHYLLIALVRVQIQSCSWKRLSTPFKPRLSREGPALLRAVWFVRTAGGGIAEPLRGQAPFYWSSCTESLPAFLGRGSLYLKSPVHNRQ